jgi:hypothetical protein
MAFFVFRFPFLAPQISQIIVQKVYSSDCQSRAEQALIRLPNGLMAEVASPREDHGKTQLVAGGDDVRVVP